MQRRDGACEHLVAGLLLAATLCLAGASGLSTARAATEAYAIDAGHSSVGFSITHFFSRVTGRFAGIEGTITFDPEHMDTGSVRVVIDAGSIDTANTERDRHLRSADFFDVANHPRITFESSAVRSEGGSRAMVDGSLTLRGVSRPVTLEIEFLGSGPDLWGGYRSGFEARTTIDRKDFGMTWNEALDSGGLMLGDEVAILINIEGVRQDSATEEASPPQEEPPADDGAPPADETPATEEGEAAEPEQQ
ncbi:MAG TPA: YceI family protein [Candidatus Polarisedimenticolia bacterium]|nr:YceI family protein [Candidatus Polarisedimenticolia bacterium]